MPANTLENYPERNGSSSIGVGFADDGPHLVARHFSNGINNSSTTTTTAVAKINITRAAPVHGEEEDDSVGPVFSADTGAGRAHTPQRLNRTNTPQRPRSSSLLYSGAAPVQASAATEMRAVKRQPLGRRKQRRWENDNLLGVEKFLHGRHAREEGEAEHLTVSTSWRSSLSVLVSDQNNSAGAAEVRESIRKGLQPKLSDTEASSSRHFSGGKWQDAEERFLLVERRLRDIVVRALRNSALLSFVVGLETLLEAFVKHRQAMGPIDMPAALSSALAAHPTVVMAGSEKSPIATLLVPLGPSPFHRLLLHALCQYRNLRSKSEEAAIGRIVHVTAPTSSSATTALPAVLLAEFVVQTRLGGGDQGIVRCMQAVSPLATEQVPSTAPPAAVVVA